MARAQGVLGVVLSIGLAVGVFSGARLDGRAVHLQDPVPAPPPQQRWSGDAIIVALGNRVLLAYAGYSFQQQQRLATAVMKIAGLRRGAMARLIQRDPERALQLSLRPGDRQGLPKHVSDLLESRVHATGDLTLSITETLPPFSGKRAPPSDVRWTARIGQRRFAAFVYGLRRIHQTKYDASLHGIALDDLMAVDESPLYPCDPFEARQLGFQEGEIVALDGEIPLVLPDLEALSRLREELIQQILGLGPYPLQHVLYPWTTGAKRVLVIKADYSDVGGTLPTDDQIVAAIGEVNSFYLTNSHGQTSLAATVLPAVLRLPLAAARYEELGESDAHLNIKHHAADAAEAFDAGMGGTGLYDPDAYDRVLVLTPQVFDRAIAQGDLSARHVVITGDRLVLEALAHEFGHTYGFKHSAFWGVRYAADPVGPGIHDDYGDAWDMMGGPWLDDTHLDPRRRFFNPFFRTLAGWLPASAIGHAASSGTFRLRRHDAAGATGVRAIRVPAGAGYYYWIDMRRQFEWNLSMMQGVEVRRVQDLFESSYGLVQLLDMDPRNGASIDHSLGPGETFTDAARGITIQVTDSGIDAVGWYADVTITR